MFLRCPSNETPIYSFPEYQNSNLGHLEAGFDVRGDYVAASSDDDYICIWDLGIKPPDSHEPHGIKLLLEKLGHANCLRFDQSRDKAPRLLVATDENVSEFTW